jgi:hypothetical protein
MMMARVFLAILVTVAATACERVALTAPTDSSITILADQSVLPLNGKATVRAIVIEVGGTPVHNGTVVTFTSTLGTVDPVTAQTVNGIATATFNAGGTSGKSTIKAFSGGAVTETGVDVTIGAAAAKTIALSATPSSVSQSGGTVTVSALVLDESGNALPGVGVNFSADNGQLNPTTAISDSSGVARTLLTTTQTSKVTATAGTATKDVTVTVSSSPTVTVAAPDSGVVGVPVPITVTAASGGATPRQIQTLTVDFGDGSIETRSNVAGATAFLHTYQRPGGYTITATATDVGGNTGVGSDAIVVNRTTPTVTVTPSDTTPTVNQTIGFTLSATPGNAGLPIEQLQAFIDGALVYTTNGSSGAFSHTFTSTGTYLVEVRATDAAGNVGRASTFLPVAP